MRSQLVYCSPLWRPYLIKDFERIQRRVTKFILNDYNLDYKSRLFQCKILPLMYFFELKDILFFVKSVKSPSSAFNIFNYVTFNTSSTRSGYFSKLLHNFATTSYTRHFYFNRIVRLWNSLPFVTGFARRGLIRAPLQNTDFTTILWIHHQTIHVCMFCGQQLTSLLSPRLLSGPCQTAMNARFVLSRLCWLFNKGYQAVRSHTTLW